MGKIQLTGIAILLTLNSLIQITPVEAASTNTFKVSVNVTYNYSEQATLKPGQNVLKATLIRDALFSCKMDSSLKYGVIQSASGKFLINKPLTGTAVINSAGWYSDSNGESKYIVNANCVYSLNFNLNSLLSSAFYKFNVCGKYCDISSPRYTANFLKKQKIIQVSVPDISQTRAVYSISTWTEPPAPSAPTFKVSNCINTRMVSLEIIDPIFNNSVFDDWKIKVDPQSQADRTFDTGRFTPIGGDWEFGKSNGTVVEQTSVSEVPFDLVVSDYGKEFRFKYLLLPGCQGVKVAP